LARPRSLAIDRDRVRRDSAARAVVPKSAAARMVGFFTMIASLVVDPTIDGQLVQNVALCGAPIGTHSRGLPQSGVKGPDHKGPLLLCRGVVTGELALLREVLTDAFGRNGGKWSP